MADDDSMRRGMGEKFFSGEKGDPQNELCSCVMSHPVPQRGRKSQVLLAWEANNRSEDVMYVLAATACSSDVGGRTLLTASMTMSI